MAWVFHAEPGANERRTIREMETMNIGKTLAVVAAGGMLAGLVACGGDKPAANSPDPAASGTPAPAKSSCNAKGSCNGAGGGTKSSCNGAG